MPTDIRLLQTAARRALASYTGAVRSGDFVAPFEAAAQYELRRVGLTRTLGASVGVPLGYERSTVVLGANYPKQLDVWFRGGASGPLLGISFKSMMGSVGQNVNNRWEELAGDAANLHSRFPMLVLGYVMVLPYMSKRTLKQGGKRITVPEPIIDPTTGSPTDLALSIEKKFRGARGRRDIVDPPAICEEVALLVFDFSLPTPVLHPTFPGVRSGLRIEAFYEKLALRFRQRNAYF